MVVPLFLPLNPHCHTRPLSLRAERGNLKRQHRALLVAKRSRIWLYQYRYDVAAFVLLVRQVSPRQTNSTCPFSPHSCSFPSFLRRQESILACCLRRGRSWPARLAPHSPLLTRHAAASPTGVVSRDTNIVSLRGSNPRCPAPLAAKRSCPLSFPACGTQRCVPYKNTQTHIVIPAYCHTRPLSLRAERGNLNLPSFLWTQEFSCDAYLSFFHLWW